jgi:hypothetical protein
MSAVLNLTFSSAESHSDCTVFQLEAWKINVHKAEFSYPESNSLFYKLTKYMKTL